MSFNYHYNEDNDPTIFDYWLIFTKHIKLFLIVSLGIFIPVTAFTLSRPDIYQARCVLLYKVNAITYINEQKEIASSHEVISGLEKSIYGNLSDENEPRIKINVEPKRNSGIVTFSYDDKDKKKAVEVVRKWVKRYLVFNSIYSMNNDKSEGSILIITKPYLIGKVDNKLKSIIISLLFAISIGVGAVFFKNCWEEHKKKRGK